MPRLVPEKIYDATLGCLSMHSAILLEQDRSTTLMIMIMKGSWSLIMTTIHGPVQPTVWRNCPFQSQSVATIHGHDDDNDDDDDDHHHHHHDNDHDHNPWPLSADRMTKSAVTGRFWIWCDGYPWWWWWWWFSVATRSFLPTPKFFCHFIPPTFRSRQNTFWAYQPIQWDLSDPIWLTLPDRENGKSIFGIL